MSRNEHGFDGIVFDVYSSIVVVVVCLAQIVSGGAHVVPVLLLLCTYQVELLWNCFGGSYCMLTLVDLLQYLLCLFS